MEYSTVMLTKRIALPLPSQFPVAAGGDVCRPSTAPPQRKSLAPTGILRSTEDAPTPCVLITSPHTAAQNSATA